MTDTCYACNNTADLTRKKVLYRVDLCLEHLQKVFTGGDLESFEPPRLRLVHLTEIPEELNKTPPFEPPAKG